MYHVYYLYIEGEENPFYVGKTNRLHKRKIEHLSDARRKSNLRARKISKAIADGKEIIMKVVATVETEDEVNVIEQELIALHGRRDTGTGFLCNHTDGGEGTSNWTCTEETRLKMSIAKIGHKINLGRKRPDMVERFSKPVQCYNEQGEWLFTCASAREAATKTGVHFGLISDQMKGKIKATKSKDGNVYMFRDYKDNANIQPARYRCRDK